VWDAARAPAIPDSAFDRAAVRAYLDRYGHFRIFYYKVAIPTGPLTGVIERLKRGKWIRVAEEIPSPCTWDLGCVYRGVTFKVPDSLVVDRTEREVWLHLGTRSVVQVISIRKIPAEATAEVSFEWSYADFTDIGRTLKGYRHHAAENRGEPMKPHEIALGRTYSRRVTFALFDDGWRIASPIWLPLSR
jgi:hypothetical protein